MPRQVGNGRLVDAAPRIDVHRVGDFVRWFRILVILMLGLILTGRRQ